MARKKKKEPSKMRQKYDQMIQGKYYNVDYNRIKPEERDEIVGNAVKDGVARMSIGLLGALALVGLLFWVITNMKV